MSVRNTRREFLQQSAIAGAGLWAGRRLWAQASQPSGANERLAVAVVGVAGQGAWNLAELLAIKTVDVVALCDVDEQRAASAREKLPKAVFDPDFRRIIERQDVDAVLIATPDHTHAAATLMALRAGKHVYCEKPLTRTVREARLVAQTAAQMKRVTQMGTQIHSGSNYRRVVELIQTGAIGPVNEVHVWVDVDWSGRGARPKDAPPVPEGLHYDLWLGPAPYRPYHPAYIPAKWRGWWDFGGGGLGDMGCHYTDLPFWALELRAPTRVRSEGPPVHPESTPTWMIVHYDYPARKTLPPVKLTWYHGKRHPNFRQMKIPDWGSAVLFVGKKGMLMADYGRYLLLPEKRFEGFQPPERFIPDSIGHHREWVEACKTGATTSCNFDYGGALTEAILLGNVAYRSGTMIQWDAAKMKITSPSSANRFLQADYREGWMP